MPFGKFASLDEPNTALALSSVRYTEYDTFINLSTSASLTLRIVPSVNCGGINECDDARSRRCVFPGSSFIEWSCKHLYIFIYRMVWNSE